MNKYLKKAENGSGIDHYVRVPGTGAKQKITFTKMHGCANDYVYIDCFQNDIQNYAELAIYLSDRHTGIGGDGVIYICPSDIADARMRMYNLDGSEGMMCGNGIRCVGKYLYDNGMTDGRTTITIDTLSGVKTLELTVKDGKMQSARVDMGAAILAPREIPVDMTAKMSSAHPSLWTKKVYHMTCVSWATRTALSSRRRMWTTSTLRASDPSLSIIRCFRSVSTPSLSTSCRTAA